MVEISEKAGKYAEGKVNEVVNEVVARAYMDGFRDGYKTREEEIPVNLRDNKTEYVDLGLPSGTLWSTDYEKEGGEIIYLPYVLADNLSIPTEEQWNELFNICKWTTGGDNPFSNTITYFCCIGPNGKSIRFTLSGYYDTNKQCSKDVFFWNKDVECGNEKSMACVRYNGIVVCMPSLCKIFSGYKLPVRLVKTKM